MRFINHLIFLLALVVGIVFIVLNLSFLQVWIGVDYYYGRGVLPLNLIIVVAALVILLLQWLIVQSAWAFRHKKLAQAQSEVMRLRAKMYDLHEGSGVEEIKDSITETRRGIREDLTWMVSGSPYQVSPEEAESK